MDKAPEAFKTISEAAEELDVPQHVLRFWETRFSQIKPMKRGGGRRYYRPNDVDLLKGIRFLLYGQGYTIRGVQRILRENGVSDVAAIGRGEMAADAFAPPVKQQAERVAKVVRAGEDGGAATEQAAAGPKLDKAAVETLREALADLEAARDFLAGSAAEKS